MYLWVDKPAVVEQNIKQIKDDALRRVLKIWHTCKTHINIEACGQLWQHSHRVAHVLWREWKYNKTQSLLRQKYIQIHAISA